MTMRQPPVLDRLITRIETQYSDDVGAYGLPEVEGETRQTVWVARRDFTGRDLLDTNTDRAVAVGLSRWTVRAGGVAWTEGDTFEDGDGVVWTVEGIAQLDRGRFLELTSKRVG